MGVEKESEAVVADFEEAFNCCLDVLVEWGWIGFLGGFTFSRFQEDRVEDDGEFFIFFIGVLAVNESLMQLGDGRVRGESLSKDGDSDRRDKEAEKTLFVYGEWD